MNRTSIAGLMVFVLVLLAAPARSWADTTATIQGTVTDATGAVVPGASVTVTNEGTNQARTMKTDAGGNFIFLLLPVGNYTLQVENQGFQTHIVHSIHLVVNQIASFDVSLEVGTVSSRVEVKAKPLQVDTTTTQVGTVINSAPIVNLPLNGRNVYQLIALQPGITVPGNADPNNPIFGSAGPLIYSSGGSRLVMNNFMVDGGDTNEINENEGLVQLMPDAVQEFKVITNTFDAEYGRNAGSIVNVVTKSGANNFHGDAWEFMRNTGLNARNFFELNRAPYHLNQFGATLGGPIKKDKTFFFLSFQETRERTGVPGSLLPVYSVPARSGNLSSRNPAGFTGSLTNNLCFPVDAPNPANCFAAGTPYSQIFPNATIPTSYFDPLAQKIMSQFIPQPNVGGQYLSVSPVQPLNDAMGSAKLDHQLTNTQRLTGFYYYDDNAQTAYGLSSLDLPGFPVISRTRNQEANLTDTWIINPTTLNEVRFSYLREGNGSTSNPTVTFSPTAYGFTGINTGPPTNLQSLPVIDIAGGPVFQGPGAGSGGGSNIQNTFEGTDNFSKVVGAHTLKFGGNVERIRYDQQLVYLFDGAYTFGGFGPNTTGDPYADFLLGLPDSYTEGNVSNERLRTTYAGLYAQDTWKIRSNVTLNAGVRWELFPPFTEQNNAVSVYRFPSAPGQPAPQSTVFPTAPPGLLFPGDKGVPRGLTSTDYHAFGPRIGLAYSPFGSAKTVIRAAFGMFYNPIEQEVLLQFNGDPPYGGSTFIGGPGFANPFVSQSGQVFPNPFPFVPPQPGQHIDFSGFYPIFQFGNFPPQMPDQYMEQYNFFVERQLTPSLVLTMGYVGSEGHHLIASYDANAGNPSLCLQLQAYGCGAFGEDLSYTTASGQTYYGTRPAGAFSNVGGTEDFGSIFTIAPVSNSNYNSGQLRLERRGETSQFLVSYTYSKSIDNTSGFENLLNPFCFACDRTLSGFDARHHLVVSYGYTAPFGRWVHSDGALKKLADGWQFEGIYTLQSGIPVHLTDSASDNSLTGSFDFETADRPSVTGPVQYYNPHQNNTGVGGTILPNLYFNPNSFTTEPLGQIGNASHNMFPGPRINNYDFSVLKDTKFTERFTLEFRAEFFNLFNHTQFYNPDGDIGAGTQFGQITTARDPRFVQFALKLLF